MKLRFFLDEPIEVQMLEIADIYVPITCRTCTKKRAERREILWEFIETEKKYTRDLQIIIDEFYQPMLVRIFLMVKNSPKQCHLSVEFVVSLNGFLYQILYQRSSSIHEVHNVNDEWNSTAAATTVQSMQS